LWSAFTSFCNIAGLPIPAAALRQIFQKLYLRLLKSLQNIGQETVMQNAESLLFILGKLAVCKAFNPLRFS